MHEHNHGSYLGNLDEAFTFISKKVLRDGVESIISNNPAEICHHMSRRLTSPQSILDAKNLAPVTGKEHYYIHAGRILVDPSKDGDGRITVVDFYGAHFIVNPKEFRDLWQHYLDEWYSKRGPW